MSKISKGMRAPRNKVVDSLRDANGGFVDGKFRPVKSRISALHEAGASLGLREFADGGIALSGLRRADRMIDETVKPSTASVAPTPPSTATPVPASTPEPQSAEEQALRAKYGVGVAKPTMMQKLKGKLGFADGGQADDFIKKNGLRGAISAGRHGRGLVQGPGGPTDDKVPAMLSNGEYVLPVKTVQHVGKENLDDLVMETNHREPVNLRAGAHMATGGGGELDFSDARRVTRSYNPNPIYVDSQGTATLNQPGTASATSGAPAPGVNTLRTVGEKTGRMAGTVARFAAPVAAGVAATAPLTGFGDYKIADEGVDSSVMGTLRAAGNQIKSAFQGTAMPSDREASQASLRKGAVETGLDVASGFAKTGDWAAGLVGARPNLQGQLDSRVKSDIGNVLEHSPTPSTTAASPSIPSKPSISSPEVANASGSMAPSSPGGLRHWTDEKGAVHIEGSSPVERRNLYTPEQRGAMRVEQYRSNMTPETSTPSLRAMPELPVPGSREDPNSWSWMAARRDRALAQQAANEHLRAETERRGQDIVARTAAAGQIMNARIAAANAAREQFNKDRDFNFEQRKAYGDNGSGGEVGRAEAEARQKAYKAVHERIGTMIPQIAGADGKMTPDVNTAARYATGLNAMLGNKMAKVEAHLKANPDDAQAAAWLARARQQGVGIFDDSDVRKYVTGMQAADLAQQEHSAWSPLYGTGVVSDEPVQSLRRVDRMILPDYYETNRGDKIPARVIDKRGTFLGLGGQRRTDFDQLKEKGLRAGS